MNCDAVINATETDCDREAVAVLVFRGQPGHAHTCPQHEAHAREFLDVTSSYPMPCPWPETCWQGVDRFSPPPL